MWFETNEGELIYLKPGNTWIQLVPLPEQMDSATEWVQVG
jgi:enterochelin esterase-like enzyme